MRLRLTLPHKGAIAFYAAVMGLALLFFSPQKINTNLLTIFPQNSYTAQLSEASSLMSLNRLVILSKGFDKASGERIDAIASKLIKVPEVESIIYKTDNYNSQTARYLQRTFSQRAQLHSEHLNKTYIHQKLSEIYTQMSTSFVFVPLNTHDPLALFSDPLQATETAAKNGYLSLDEKGLMLSAMVNIAVADVSASQKFYEEIKAITTEYGDDVIAFSPHFFTAENSAKIKGEVNLIISATMLLLLLFYLFSLRDIKMLLLSSLALASSLFVGLSAVTIVFDSVSVFTIAFGSAIAMMAVDYLFHYYFHGYYTAKEKERRKVLQAFLTTAGGFAILSLADFPLIRQLSVLGIVALGFSYFQFTFLFSKWQLEPHQNRLKMPSPSRGYIKPIYLFIFALCLIGVGAAQLRFDGDLRQLDYHNSAMLELQKRFSDVKSEKLPLLIYSDSLDGVIEKAEKLKSKNAAIRSIADMTRSQTAYAAYQKELLEIDVDALRESLNEQSRAIGFREGLFSKTYASLQSLPPYEHVDLDIARQLGFETKALSDGRWLSLAYIDSALIGDLSDAEDVTVLQAASLLERGVEGALSQLLIISVMTLLLISVILFILFGTKMLRALNYVLIPLGVILFALSLSGSLSVMHLFAMIIVMVAGIDYGIYMSHPKDQTDEAIYYAMLTTFAGFGVFVFSHIGALHHIGSVITLAIIATFILQRLQLRSLRDGSRNALALSNFIPLETKPLSLLMMSVHPLSFANTY